MSLRAGLGPTYRLQLRPGWGFADAASVVPYLVRLGVETVYLSPIAEAVPGSPHGYDGTDPTRVRDELGGEAGYDALVRVCEAHGLGICVDHVPNHLSTSPNGPWWRRLLQEGRDSPMGEVFDVDWEAGRNKVLLPYLDRPLDDALAGDLVRVTTDDDGEPVLVVGGTSLPLADGTAEVGGPREVLAAQHYALVDWHDARARNYRRFFDIDGLVGVRVELPGVFEATHALVRRLAHEQKISALRVDHVDGLREPTAYLRRLREATGVPVVVEKILTGDELVRTDWPVLGTTGYETLDDIGGVLVDAHGYDRLVAQGRAEGDEHPDALTVATRRLVARTSFPGEVERLAGGLGFDADAVGEVLARLPRYRTYLEPAGDDDLGEIAIWRTTARDGEVRGADEIVGAVLDPARRNTTLRIQQFTGALMAKGVEDTAWYRLAGPLAFCEVGGEPGRARHDALARVHERASQRVGRGIHGLVPGTTHDTKRAADVRCRLYALSEMAAPFEAGLDALRSELSGRGLRMDDMAFETRVAAQLALAMAPPDGPSDGAGDASWDRAGGDSGIVGRLGDALVKGAREAKRRSSWTAPDEAYEARLRELAAALLEDRGALVRASFGVVAEEAVRLGAVNSLAAVVLRHAFPGIPDCYQGDEAWNLSLVDPDNRRPVDYARLAAALGEGAGRDDPRTGADRDVATLRREWRDGRVKVHVTAGCLRARHGPGADALAPDATYVPLAASGPTAGSVLAFARRAKDAWAVAVVTRLPGRLEADGDDLPAGDVHAGTVVAMPEDAPGRFVDVLSARPVRLGEGVLRVDEVLATLPVALLVAPGTP